MTSYVANFQKKIRIRSEKEEKLRRLIASGKDEEKLLKTAEVVRDARIRELQAKKAQISPEASTRNQKSRYVFHEFPAEPAADHQEYKKPQQDRPVNGRESHRAPSSVGNVAR